MENKLDLIFFLVFFVLSESLSDIFFIETKIINSWFEKKTIVSDKEILLVIKAKIVYCLKFINKYHVANILRIKQPLTATELKYTLFSNVKYIQRKYL